MSKNRKRKSPRRAFEDFGRQAKGAIEFDAFDVRFTRTPVEEGAKHDTGKPQWHLLPWRAVEAVVRVLDHGALKYAPDNWRKVDRGRERYYSAAMRHLVAWHCGEPLDTDSGLPHLAHAACCVLFLLALDQDDGG